jgi:hypothetical protein
MWNLPHRITVAKFNGITRRRRTNPDIRMKVSNLTRQAELARCVEVANRLAMLFYDHRGWTR